MNKNTTPDIKPILAEPWGDVCTPGSLYIADPVAGMLKELNRVMGREDRRQFDDDEEEDDLFDDDDDDDEEEDDLFDDDDDDDDFDEDDDLYARHRPAPAEEPWVRHLQINELACADVRFI